jgi:hypothetical protein
MVESARSDLRARGNLMEVESIGYLESRVVPEPPGTMGFIG